MEPQEPQEHPEGSVEAKIVEALKTCYDPEIPVDIYELGLIYAIEVQDVDVEEGDGKKVLVTMTLTSPACPVAGSLPGDVQRTVLDQVEELSDSQVDLTWDPPWSIDRMSEAAKLQLGMM
ncbi:MAG: iron-sulfur cluster assembly protein [Candidatus Latescibacterota bacterium]|jgi:FeS assembly SUF system protein